MRTGALEDKWSRENATFTHERVMPPFDNMAGELTAVRLVGGGLLLTEKYMLVSMDFGHLALFDVDTKELIGRFDPLEELLWHKSCFSHASGYFILMIWKGDQE